MTPIMHHRYWCDFRVVVFEFVRKVSVLCPPYLEQNKSTKIKTRNSEKKILFRRHFAIYLLRFYSNLLKLQLHDAIYRLRFYLNLLIHILSLSNSHNNLPSMHINQGDKSHRVIVPLFMSERFQPHTMIHVEFKGISQTNCTV